MSDTRNNDRSVDEKKVWRPVSATQCFPPETDDFPDNCVYFIAVEELQGAFIDGVWEEAGSDDEDVEYDKKTIINSNGEEETYLVKIEKPRARRYVLKKFSKSGFAENALTSPYNGNRRYRS